MPESLVVDPPAAVSPSSPSPRASVPTIPELLGQLAGRPITQRILHATFAGGRAYQHRDPVLRIFPYLKGVTIVEPDAAERERLRAATAGNPLVAVVTALEEPFPATDMLLIDREAAGNYAALELPAEFTQRTKLVCASADLELEENFQKLSPGPHSTASGPALYVHADWCGLATNPASGDAPKSISPEVPAKRGGPPRISVLVSTYNAEKYLRACLADLEEQTIADQLEIIVIDSGSEQKERAIVEEFQARYSNIAYVRTEREPLYTAWNRGVQLARGKYITNANSDDAHRPDALELLAAALDANPVADLAYGDYYNSSAPNDHFSAPRITRRVVHPPYHPATLMFYCVTGCHPMWRRGVFFKLGVFDTQYMAPGDYDFLLRLAQAGLRAVRVPEFLSLFYQNPKGLSLQSANRSRHEWALIQAKYREEMPIERLFKVVPSNPESVALGWTALGNLAMNIKVPWFDNFSQDVDFAVTCYERALARSPRQPAALNNLAIARALKGQMDLAEPLLRSLAPAQLNQLVRDLNSGNMKIMPVNVAPAVEPLEYRPSRPSSVFAGAVSAPAPLKPVASGSAIPRTTVRWIAPFLSPGEYSRDSLNAVLGLAPFVPAFATLDHTGNYSDRHELEMPAAEKAVLLATRAKFNFVIGGIAIAASPPDEFFTPGGALYGVGRTTIEADTLPASSANVCNQMREIWVPSRWILEIFAGAGVERSKLRVVPASVDPVAFSAEGAAPFDLPRRAAWNYLFCDDWSERSGWDVLLGAYFREFSAADDVCLYIGSRLPGKTGSESAERIGRQAELVATTLGATARFEVLSHAESELPGVLRACDCVVLPSRAEGWGRNQLQAMLMGKLVITTGWGAHMDFCSADNCSLLAYKLVEIRASEAEFLPLRGLKWAEPSLERLRATLREAQQNPSEARAKGRGHAAALAAIFDRSQVGRLVAERLCEIERKMNSPSCDRVEPRLVHVEPESPGHPASPPQVSWEGSFLDHGSLSHVNRELTAALLKRGDLQLSCGGDATRGFKFGLSPALDETARRLKSALPKNVQVTVRHNWPPLWQAPGRGAWVLIQPWEYGVVPLEWVRQIKRVDEVWVPSDYARRTYVDAGVDSAKVRVVPNGVNPEKFHPDVPPLALASRKKHKFLFVGGTIPRKGIDALLKAYIARFTAADDVCLVVKDFGVQGVYQGQTTANDIKAIQTEPNTPEVLYLTDDLATDQIASLYTACDCLVHPYRGEGFGLPVLEAMACGLPVIVTAGGATDDFASDDYAYRIPSRRTPLSTTISGMKLAHPGWWLEPSLEALGERMRWVVANPGEARSKGRAASDYVRANWTWERAASVAARRLRDLVARHEAKKSAAASGPLVPAGVTVQAPPVARLGNLAVAREQFAAQDFPAAWSAVAEAIQTRPFHPEAFQLGAEIAAQAGDCPRARRCAEIASNLAPKWEEPRRFLKGAGSAAAKPSLGLPPLPNSGPGSPESPRLTACLIVKNEEEFIERCLRSLAGVADQIVMLDTGSTDRTIEIARARGAEVYSRRWDDDFSAARNEALGRARGAWVLVIDADEELTPEGRAALAREMEAPGVMAWRLPIIDAGREANGCNYVPRLFRNAPGLFFHGRIHEHAFHSVENFRKKFNLANKLGSASLKHHGYDAEVRKSRDKTSRNIRLVELALAETPGDANLWMNLALELGQAGQRGQAVEAYARAFQLLSSSPPDETAPELREALLTQYSAAVLADKNAAAVAEILQSSLARGSGGLTATMHFTLGLALVDLEKFDKAADHFRQCVATRGQPALTPLNPDILKAAPHHALALCLSRLKQLGLADKAFRAAFEADPKARGARFDHARLLGQNGREAEALQKLRELAREDVADADTWNLGGQIALHRPDLLAVADEWTSAAIKFFPHHPAIVAQRAEVEKRLRVIATPLYPPGSVHPYQTA
jgi:glycosyltransferase involved in cell wall biosynthesis/Tfp pilus assembly protein PilF